MIRDLDLLCSICKSYNVDMIALGYENNTAFVDMMCENEHTYQTTFNDQITKTIRLSRYRAAISLAMQLDEELAKLTEMRR